MGRRAFDWEFELEAVKLVRERGNLAAQAARDLGIHANVISRWVREAQADKVQAFPGRGQMQADDAEIARLKRELAKTLGLPARCAGLHAPGGAAVPR